MISFISNWTKEIGITIIIVSILEMLIPNNKNKKYIRMVLGVFVIFNLISPLIANKDVFSFDIDKFELDNYRTITTSSIDQTSMDSRINKLYEEELEKDIKKKIEEKGFKVINCKVKTIVNKEQSKIERIELKLEKKEEKIDNIDEENKENKIDNKVESIVIEEIQKIKKVDIDKQGVEMKNNIDTKKESENKEQKENTKLTKIDIYEIKDFIKKEYGVSEKCLKIN